MNRIWKIIIGISIATILVSGLIVYGLYLMSIEDRYGDLQEVYFEAEDYDLIIYDTDKVAFIRLFGREVFVEEAECMKHLLYFSDKKIEIYRVKDPDTYFKRNVGDGAELKNDPNSKLIYKN